jgi:glycosyltransferase involved in cell wall biosynthesis
MRVLIASNDPELVPSQVQAYEARGWDVATGISRFYERATAYELVHLHWPEELVGWRPTDEALGKLDDTLRWWRKRARIVATVHNLLPHDASTHQLDKRLYEMVYAEADLIGHFSQYSLEQVRALFPDVPASKHVVHPPHLFDHMRRFSVGREPARRRFRLATGKFAILVFGALRTVSELNLVVRSLALCDIPDSRILFAGRFKPTARWKRMLYDWRMKRLQRKKAVQVFKGFIPAADTTVMFEAADVVLIPRSGHHLNSGVVSLAMTLGTPIVAPRYGAFVEHLGETMNALYRPKNHRAMAAAIQDIARQDISSIAAANAAHALDWGWDKSVTLYAGPCKP